MIITRELLEGSLDRLVRSVRDPNEGILGRDSITWQLGGDLGVFLGGGRAVLLQLAHPQVAYAIDHHSQTRADVLGRFQRTFHHVFGMLFGDLDTALIAARRVHAIHSRVHGEIDGVAYHANDADALRWVHATLIDTTIAVRRLLGAELSAGDLDRYTIEARRFAMLFGIPDDRLPRSWAEHVHYMARMMPKLDVVPCAREMARFLIGRSGAIQPPLGALTEALAAAMLPDDLVREFALRRSDRRVSLAMKMFAPIYNRLPTRVTRLPAHVDAQRRLRGEPPSRFAAWTERQLFGLSRKVTG
ncbi:MAG: oxygenase MpaB family protein [Kofleriaceae bacterium]